MIPMRYTKTNSLKARVVASLFLFFVLSLSAVSVQGKMMSINGDKVNLRTGPDTKYSVKWEYGSGFPVKVIESKGKWVKIKDFENDTGWIHESLLAPKPQVIVKANKNQEQKINIRSKPGIDGDIVGRAYYGVVFSLLQQEDDWAKVKHETGLTGWINKSLLWGL